MILLLLILEIIEHLIANTYGRRAHELYDAVRYVLLVPTGTWLLLTLLKGSENEREQTIHDSDLQTELSQQLGSAYTWGQLIQSIISYPHQVAPNVAVTLYVYNAHTARMQPEATCSRSGEVNLRPHLSLNPDSLPVGSIRQILMQNGAASTPSPVLSPDVNLPPNRYDLPITRNDQPIGLFKLEFPDGTSPIPHEIQTIKRAIPLIALALEGGLLQNLAAEQAAASESERQEIAQNLHDSLAQNVSYLRLKLDQLTGENAFREIGAVLQELERMRSTADEAYQQVRNTLDELGPTHSEDVVTIVTKQARTISERGGFNLRITQTGAPYALPALTRQQILYIAREALHNVEKHARASQVLLQFTWLESELILKITDNGIGFDPLTVPQDGHYGLWIMQQRAQDLGGTLKISPPDEQGTEVTLWIPRSANKA